MVSLDEAAENLILCIEENKYDQALALLTSSQGLLPELCNKIGKKGFNPLQCAAFYSLTDMVKLLLEKGADPNQPTATTLRRDVEWYEQGTTALHIACSKDNSDTVEMLLAAGAVADLSNKGAAEQTPLHVAAEFGCLQNVKLLVDKGVDVNTADQSGELPLHKAARGGHNSVIMFLLTHQTEVNTKNAAGYTPLMQSVSEGHLKTTLLLLENGADISVQDPDLNSLLSVAVMNQKEDIIPLLMDNQVDPNLQNVRGDTALHIACQLGNSTIVEMLMESGLELDIQNNLKQTALHLAAMSNNHSSVTQLIASGAKTDIEDGEGHTASICTTDKSLAAIINTGKVSPPPMQREKTILDMLPPTSINLNEKRLNQSPVNEDDPVYISQNSSPEVPSYHTTPREISTPISNPQSWKTEGHERPENRQRHKPPNRINVLQSENKGSEGHQGQFKKPIGVDKATIDVLKQKLSWLEGQIVTLGIGDDKAALLYRQLGKLEEELVLAKQMVKEYMSHSRPLTPRMENNKVVSPSPSGLMSPRGNTTPRDNGRRFNPNFMVETIESLKSELQMLKTHVKPSHTEKMLRFYEQVESLAIAVITFAHKMAVTLAL